MTSTFELDLDSVMGNYYIFIFIDRVAGAIIGLVASVRPFVCGHSPV